MPTFGSHKLLDACREEGCPVCRLEQQSVERYLENQFYENVNSPKWRAKLRGSLGFCYEHAWQAVDQRLGDALGFSIIYRDLLNDVIKRLEESNKPTPSSRRWTSLLRQDRERVRTVMEKALGAIAPTRICPVCEHRQETNVLLISGMLEALEEQEVSDALRASDGLCIPHLQRCLQTVKNVATCEKLLDIHRGKLKSLKAELEEFIRKNDYQVEEAIGREGDAWLRAVTMIVGRRTRK